MVNAELIGRVLDDWMNISQKQFARDVSLTESQLVCDCSGLIFLLEDHFQIKPPFQVERPKALHYFALLQEIGSDKVDKLEPGNILAWRKDNPPKSGDTGHVLIVASKPRQLDVGLVDVDVYDATKREKGLAKRTIQLQVDDLGCLIGVKLHASDTKIKRTPIYHGPFGGGRQCPGCALPVRICSCEHINPSAKSPKVIILRHPDERGRTLSTVSLIKQRYPSVLVKEGEIFQKPRIERMAVLFPDNGNNKPEAREVDLETTLILIDATWKKAKKILHLNPWFNDLPKVSINPEKLSSYKIRKVPDASALSTVEAFAEVSNSPELHDLFDAFVSRQIETMGREVYERNYRHYLNFEEMD